MINYINAEPYSSYMLNVVMVSVIIVVLCLLAYHLTKFAVKLYMCQYMKDDMFAFPSKEEAEILDKKEHEIGLKISGLVGLVGITCAIGINDC